MPSTAVLADLRLRLAALDPGSAGTSAAVADTRRVGFGCAELDAALRGGLVRAALHEIHAPGTASLPAATALALALAWRAAGERPILWARQDALEAETGRPYAPGLVELGLDPARVLLVRARDAVDVLRAGADAARCPALGAVVIEPWGEPRQLDLTASRRLALLAEASGVLTLLLRAAPPQPSAARSRWLVEPDSSQALEADAPGDPAFRLRLLRQRGGTQEGEWRLAWDRERRCFRPADPPSLALRPETSGRSRDAAPLSRPLAALPADGPAGGAPARRRAG